LAWEYFIEATTNLNEPQLEAIRNWLRAVENATVYTKDHDTWFLFRDESQKERRIQWWQDNPSKNDYLTSSVVILPDGIALSLVESDVDTIAADLAKWWLFTFGGRLLDGGGIEISPDDIT